MTKYEKLINERDEAVNVAQSRIEEKFFDDVTSSVLDFICNSEKQINNLTLAEAMEIV